MVRGRWLAGERIGVALAALGAQTERQRSGGTDPESVAEFLALDIPFDVEPAVGVVFPPEVRRG